MLFVASVSVSNDDQYHDSERGLAWILVSKLCRAEFSPSFLTFIIAIIKIH